MHTSPAKPGWHVIDGQRVYTDSLTEARVIKRLVNKHGFSGKWSRPRTGIEFGSSRYTPDLELSVDIGSISYRGLVEIKATSATQFTMRDRERACTAAHFYTNAILLLYIDKTNRWYHIDPASKYAVSCPVPIPARSSLSSYSRPSFAIPTLNRFARPYRSKPSAKAATIIANGLEFGVRAFFGPGKKTRRRRKR